MNLSRSTPFETASEKRSVNLNIALFYIESMKIVALFIFIIIDIKTHIIEKKYFYLIMDGFIFIIYL